MIKNNPLRNITPKVARQQQKELAEKLVIQGMLEKINVIAGIDIAYSKKPLTGFCAIALFSYPDLKHLKTYTELDLIGYPYIPGLLTYREGPLILDTMSKIEEEIDLFIFDGQGIAHPNRMGIASHIGLLLDKPAIGCAKNRLVGEYEEPGEAKGSSSDLKDDKGNLIGKVLRTRDDTNPVFVSPGHKIGVEEANEIVLNCTTDYRLSEPTRIADQEAEKYKKEGDI